jgi:hypothetical protein
VLFRFVLDSLVTFTASVKQIVNSHKYLTKVQILLRSELVGLLYI